MVHSVSNLPLLLLPFFTGVEFSPNVGGLRLSWVGTSVRFRPSLFLSAPSPYIELESEAASATSSSSSSRIGMEKRRVWRADQGRVWSRYSSASGHGKEGFSSTQRLALVTAARACINLEIHQMHKQKKPREVFRASSRLRLVWYPMPIVCDEKCVQLVRHGRTQTNSSFIISRYCPFFPVT